MAIKKYNDFLNEKIDDKPSYTLKDLENAFNAGRDQINLSTQHNPKGTKYDNWVNKYDEFNDYIEYINKNKK